MNKHEHDYLVLYYTPTLCGLYCGDFFILLFGFIKKIGFKNRKKQQLCNPAPCTQTTNKQTNSIFLK